MDSKKIRTHALSLNQSKESFLIYSLLIFLFFSLFSLLMHSAQAQQFTPQEDAEIEKDPLKWRRENVKTPEQAKKFCEYRISKFSAARNIENMIKRSHPPIPFEGDEE